MLAIDYAGRCRSMVTSILLHDSAMHLTDDGFIHLIESPDSGVISDFDLLTWGQLWETFLAQAKHYSETELRNILGDADVTARRPPRNFADWTDRDRRLIGEFVRIHHPRLAHEISLKGVPGAGGGYYEIWSPSTPDYIKDIAGMVARSHGLDLRTATDHLAKRYDIRDFNGIHAVYLMTLLRTADYLQIQPDRAPKEALELKRLRSPLSAREWSVHASVRNINHTGLDPEAIFIDALPKNSAEFRRLRQWLDGIQLELDHGWATLGEVYGRFQEQGLHRFGLRLRRVRSNLDNLETFRQAVDYVPEEVKFDTAGPQLLKLLVEPLYGDMPLIGIRELTQNAVDAVRERDFILQAESPDNRDATKVEISIKRDENGVPKTIIIKDQGVGMDLDILINYFLKAGSSFRRSRQWRETYVGDKGTPNVTRSGKFGVGSLAIFLLGERFKIETRRFSEPPSAGLCFEAKLDDDGIDVKYVACDVGTCIEIDLNESARELFRLGGGDFVRWYYMPKPQIAFSGFANEVGITDWLPDVDQPCGPHWIDVQPGNYERVSWSYSAFSGADKPVGLYCNGIWVGGISKGYGNPSSLRRNESAISIDVSPNFRNPEVSISVIDNNGNLPLNLARDRIIDVNEPNIVAIKEAVCDDILAACAKDEGVKLKGGNLKVDAERIPWLVHRKIPMSWKTDFRLPRIFLAKGFIPADLDLALDIGIKHLIVLPDRRAPLEAVVNYLIKLGRGDVGVVPGLEPRESKTAMLESIRFAFGRSSTFYGSGDFTGFSYPGRRARFHLRTSLINLQARQLVSQLSNVPNYMHESFSSVGRAPWARYDFDYRDDPRDVNLDYGIEELLSSQDYFSGDSGLVFVLAAKEVSNEKTTFFSTHCKKRSIVSCFPYSGDLDFQRTHPEIMEKYAQLRGL
jgi:hypothetical protein